ncbi:MAG: threonine ammonia-lyase [Pseudomonadota bacterium]
MLNHAPAALISHDDVVAAWQHMQGQIPNTPFVHSQTLSQITGAQIYLKFENLQYTSSFKQRGAYNKLRSLSDAEKARGVVAVSAGNHAQGVAYHAAQLGIASTIIMPTTTPNVKASRTRELGAEVLLIGDDFAAASQAMHDHIAETGKVLVHPYDDPLVIAGQGTVAQEIIESGIDLDDIVVAVGGGGLIAGVSTVFKACAPNTRITGVQSEAFPAMAQYAGFWDKPPTPGASIAEGIAVAEPGQVTRAYVSKYVDHMAVVREASIEQAVALLLQVEKTLCEGAGAAGLAAILENPDRFKGRTVGLILCGGNIDNRLLLALRQRQQVREGLLFRLSVVMPDRAGALGQLCALIGDCGGNINTVNHDRSFLIEDARCARVELEIEVSDIALTKTITAALDGAGMHYEMIG